MMKYLLHITPKDYQLVIAHLNTAIAARQPSPSTIIQLRDYLRSRRDLLKDTSDDSIVAGMVTLIGDELAVIQTMFEPQHPYNRFSKPMFATVNDLSGQQVALVSKEYLMTAHGADRLKPAAAEKLRYGWCEYTKDDIAVCHFIGWAEIREKNYYTIIGARVNGVSPETIVKADSLMITNALHEDTVQRAQKMYKAGYVSKT